MCDENEVSVPCLGESIQLWPCHNDRLTSPQIEYACSLIFRDTISMQTLTTYYTLAMRGSQQNGATTDGPGLLQICFRIDT